VKLQCSNSCACLFDVLTVYLDCSNCHFLMYSLAYCVNIKLACSLLRKTASDTVSSVLQCKYARKMQDVLAQVSKFKKNFAAFSKLLVSERCHEPSSIPIGGPRGLTKCSTLLLPKFSLPNWADVCHRSHGSASGKNEPY
jgi:hypothetical protein